MLRYIAYFLIGAVIMFGGAEATRGFVTPSVPFGKYSDYSVIKVAKDNEHGTGVYIGNGKIITAGHVAKIGKDGLTVTDAYGTTSTAHVVWFDEKADVGLLKLDLPFVDKNGVNDVLRGAPLACNRPDARIGDRLEAVGHPLNLLGIHTFGRVASVVDTRNGKITFIADLTIAPGNSGGPVFDVDGNVAGITVAIALAPVQTMFGLSVSIVPLSYIVPKSVICKELASSHEAPFQETPSAP